MSSSNFYDPSTARPYTQGSTGPYYHDAKATGEQFEDSGFFEEEATSPTPSPLKPYEDFTLYPDDAPFIDDEASVRPNHGSVYQGSNNSRSSNPSRTTTFYDPVRQQDDNDVRPVTQGSHTIYRQIDSDRPSLFAQFQQVSSIGHDPLDHWVVHPWRHESRAVHFESLPRSREDDKDSIRLTPERVSPPPSSPKHRKSKSGSSKSGRRRKH